MDLADDRFDVRHDPARVDAGTLLEAVRALGYTPEIVTGGMGARAELQRVDVAHLPLELQELLARSRATLEPLVLVEWLETTRASVAR